MRRRRCRHRDGRRGLHGRWPRARRPEHGHLGHRQTERDLRLLQRAAEVLRTLIALGGTLGHPFGDGVDHRGGHVLGREVGQRIGRDALDHGDDRLLARSHVGGDAGEQRVQRGRERVQVAARRRRVAVEQLGCDMRELGGIGHVGRVGTHQRDDTEVREQRLAQRRQHHVVGPQVAVDDAGAVGRLECAGKTDAEAEDVGPCHRRRAPKAITDRAAGHLAGDDVRHAGLAPAVAEHRDDVGVAERSHRRLLSLEPLRQPGPLTAGVEQLDDDHAARGRVADSIRRVR